MITLPIWLVVLIGIFGFPILTGILIFTIYCIQAFIIVFKDITKELL